MTERYICERCGTVLEIPRPRLWEMIVGLVCVCLLLAAIVFLGAASTNELFRPVNGPLTA
jgi:hypothetical protein